MKTLHAVVDQRIHAENFLVEMSLGEYLDIAKIIITNNEFQRRRVSSSSTIYSLLKDDFRKGCVIPPIVLALGVPSDEIAENGGLTFGVLTEHVRNLVILDGLQRTYTLIDLANEVARVDIAESATLLERPLRFEIYVGLNRLGVLYRMLTLNTGQTPMSLRQQIEMLYLDFSRSPVNGITLLKEVDDEAPTALGEYSFRTMVEGFISYIERNELPIDRFDLLEAIKSLESLSREDVASNLFPDFVSTYHAFVRVMQDGSQAHEYDTGELEIKGQPFGRDARRIFSKSQAITGFGAAIGKLRDRGDLESFQQIANSIEQLAAQDLVRDIASLLKRLEQLRLTSKKIGNAQRLYFHFFFRQLLDPKGDAYLKFGDAVDAAMQRYETEMM